MYGFKRTFAPSLSLYLFFFFSWYASQRGITMISFFFSGVLPWALIRIVGVPKMHDSVPEHFSLFPLYEAWFQSRPLAHCA
jgi:hypothetical protein